VRRHWKALVGWSTVVVGFAVFGGVFWANLLAMK